MIPSITSAILLFLAVPAQHVRGAGLVATPSTCGPTIATVGRVTTITIESIVTLTHSCFTRTLTTSRLAGMSGCPTLTKCPPAPQCIVSTTSTIKVPPVDGCCASTPTSIVPGPCPTCQTGCDVSVTTQWVTEAPTPTALAIRDEAEEKRQAACYTTVINSDGGSPGSILTVYPLTVTSTSLLNCRGCGIVTKYLYGFGPGGVAIATVTAVGQTATATAWACS